MYVVCSELAEEREGGLVDPVLEGVTFYVRYLGSCFVLNSSGEEATSEAIKSIVSMVMNIDNSYLMFNALQCGCRRGRRTGS